MVEMQMRLQHVADIGGGDAHFLQLGDAALFFRHERVVDIRHRAPMLLGVFGGFDRNPAIDHDMALGMGDQEPWNGGVELALPGAELDIDFLLPDPAGLEKIQSNVRHCRSPLFLFDVLVQAACASARIMSAAFSPIMMIAALVLAETSRGMIEPIDDRASPVAP